MTANRPRSELAARPYRRGDENRTDLIDHALIARGTRLMSMVEKYFRYQVHGLDNIPTETRGLLVSPHSLISVDGFLLGQAIHRRQGRVVRGLTDHSLFSVPGLRELILRMGIVDGNRDNAVRLLREENLCFAMPGGAYEAWKPSRERYKLFWHGHNGFVRVALRASAPIIPTVCIGAEEALYMPFHSLEWGKKLLRARLPIFAGVGVFGPIPVPFPVKFTAYVGKPLHFDVPPEAAGDEAEVARCHQRVVQAMETMIKDGLARRRSLWF